VQNKVSFDVEYQPGKIEAVGYKDGKESGRFHLVTTEEPAALTLSVDRAVIDSGYGDIAYVTIEMVDASGNLVKNADTQISISVSGAGELIAIGSGNPSSEESYVGNQHQTFQGRLLAIIRSTDEIGQISVTAQCETLAPATIQLESK
jgi:beta-galactosidase